MLKHVFGIVLLSVTLLLMQLGTASAAFDPAKTIAHGPGLTGGHTHQPLSFTIQCVDSANFPMSSDPGATWTITLSGPATLVPTLVNHNDGTLTATYTATVKGTYGLEILANGNRISGSPFTVVIYATTSAANSTASGPGVAARPGIFRSVGLTITARDDLNNLVTTGGDNFTLEVYRPGGRLVPSSLVDNLDGTYTGQYTATMPGIWTVIIKLDGVPIQGSPFHPIFLPIL
jgi:hypothetical protein